MEPSEGLTVLEYVRIEFKEFAKVAWPNGVPWSGSQHADIVRTFMAGAFIMDSSKDEGLAEYLEYICGDTWRPGPAWNWEIKER